MFRRTLTSSPAPRAALAAIVPLALALAVAPPLAHATSTEIGPADDLRAAVNALLPGDELVLRGGTYTLTFRFSIAVSGTAANPIRIRAKAGETPHLTRDPSQNVINIEGADYLTLSGLEVSAGSHGIRLNDANFITIEDCRVHNTGDVAISANIDGSSYQGLRFLRNHIHDTGGTGEGFYLGCNNAMCVMFDSLLEDNYIHDTVIGTSQGDGIEIKLGSHSNVVRRNLIHDTRYPCILVYGTEGMPVNLIEQNAMWNCGDHAIQAAADAIIRNNIILGAAQDGIRNQLHQGAVPGNLTIVHNTILNNGSAIRSDGIVGTIVIANNALYSQTASAIRAAGDLTMVTSAGNYGTGGLIGVSGGFSAGGNRLVDFVDAAAGDVHLLPGSGLIDAGDPAYLEPVDHDGLPRGGFVDIGARRYGGTGCDPSSLTTVVRLLARANGTGGITFSWDPAATAPSQYNVNSLIAKVELQGPGPHRTDLAGGLATGRCEAVAPATTCDHVGALSLPDSLLLYQVLSACGASGVDEGPWE